MTTDGTATPRKKSWVRENALMLWLTGLGTAVLFVFLIPDIFVSIKPGEAGVVWYRFWDGTNTSTYFDEGTHLRFPWDEVYIYDVRLQQITQDLTILSSDGLEVKVNVTTRFRLLPEGLGVLHKNVGPEYVERLVVPEIGAHFRSVIGRYEPEQLYTTQRELVQDQILAQMRDENKVAPFPGTSLQDLIYIEDVLIREIRLPAKVEAAIEAKLSQRHEMLEYDYRLLKEEKEKQRKKTEAEGIRLFQDIVSEGISERYLKWKGIDATLELAKSPNAKTVIIGGGKDGLPLILGPLEPSLERPPPAATPPAPKPPR